MCNLCSHDPAIKKGEIDFCNHVADRLERLAQFYRQLASGSLHPHGKKANEFVLTLGAVKHLLSNE